MLREENQRMRIIICGAGRVGTGIAAQLCAENNDITIIDQDSETLEKISNSMDVKTVLGFACHPPVLDEAGASDADMIIAVTTSDEVNMIACQIGKTIFKIPTKIARIRHQNYLAPMYQDMYRAEDMPIDVIISPEIEVAKNIINRFHVPGATDTFPIENSSSKIIASRILSGSPAEGSSVGDFQRKNSHLNMRIMGISRGQDFLTAKDRETIKDADEIYFVSDLKSSVPTMVMFGHEEKEAQKIVIIGGGNIGLYVAQELELDKGTRVKIIEINKERAEEIAEKLERTMVINGNALEEDILEEANISSAETVISVSNDDEVNILSSLLAKNMGTQTSFTLLNNHSFVPLMSNLGIDVTVNPRETTVSSILQHVRRGKIRSTHSLKEGAAEIIEAEVTESIGLVGKQINDMELPKDVLVGAIIRESEFIIPKPETVMRKRDRLIILALASEVKTVEDLFSLKAKFF